MWVARAAARSVRAAGVARAVRTAARVLRGVAFFTMLFRIFFFKKCWALGPRQLCRACAGRRRRDRARPGAAAATVPGGSTFSLAGLLRLLIF